LSPYARLLKGATHICNPLSHQSIAHKVVAAPPKPGSLAELEAQHEAAIVALKETHAEQGAWAIGQLQSEHDNKHAQLQEEHDELAQRVEDLQVPMHRPMR
jgi:hypothetical protein